MSLRSRQVLADDGLRAVLDAGEEPVEFVPVLAGTTQGADRDEPVGAPPPEPPKEGLARGIGGFFTGNWVPRWARGDAVERAVGGVARQGAPGSAGAAVAAALRDGSGVVVTDRRLLVVVQGKAELVPDPRRPGRKTVSTPFRLAAAVDRAELVAARRSGRANGRGRVELYFRDRSMAAVVTGVATTGAAGRLLAALALPDQPPPVP